MSTFERLIKVFNTVFENDIDSSTVTPQALLVEDLGINSIGMLYMAMAIEEEFGIKLKNEDITDVRTVEDITRLVDGKL